MRPQRVTTVWTPAAVPSAPADNLPAPGPYDLVSFPTVLDELAIDPSDPNIPIA
jgi:hypothetical protein